VRMGSLRVLTRVSSVRSSDGNITSLCPNGSEWVWDILGECVQDGWDMASVILGLLSIVCFMVSLGPQCYKSYRTGNMDSALSIWFLLLWLAGDSCNLVGSFLANQLPLQCYTAVYYVLADLVTLSMYGYYKTKNKGRNNRVLVNVFVVLWLTGVPVYLIHSGTGPHVDFVQPGFKGRVLLAALEDSTTSIKPFNTKEIIGFVIGSLSSLLYLGSRIPQIYTNFRRKSTEGVSYFLFALVILGNTTYGLSVLVKNPDATDSEGSYIVHHLPWLIGSLGTLSLDIVISGQFLLYPSRCQDEARPEETRALLYN
ncbi:hypothetical protein GN956_G6637, partial [Arapaima gigas]